MYARRHESTSFDLGRVNMSRLERLRITFLIPVLLLRSLWLPAAAGGQQRRSPVAPGRERVEAIVREAYGHYSGGHAHPLGCGYGIGPGTGEFVARRGRVCGPNLSCGRVPIANVAQVCQEPTEKYERPARSMDLGVGGRDAPYDTFNVVHTFDADARTSRFEVKRNR